jgi:hypothetical protein
MKAFNKLERSEPEMVLCCHLLGETEQNHEKELRLAIFLPEI